MRIDGIIVVEGKSDVAFLSNFVEAEFVITNGSEISKDTIDYLKSSSKQIYVLTDPDSPGERIRNVIENEIPNVKHCFIKKENSIKNGKVGVAESTKEEVLKALENSLTTSKQKEGNLKMSDLVELGLSGTSDSLEKRNALAEQFHLGHCNAKTFLKRANYRGINIDDLKSKL